MDQKDIIKESFTRAREDILNLKENVSYLINEIEEIKRTLNHMLLQSIASESNVEETPTQIPQDTFVEVSESNNPTDDWPYKRLKPHIYSLSTGNRGVPTNRQTDKQTNNPTHFSHKIDQIERVSELIDSLDSIKKELRYKFRHLTKQEMLVFSTIYQLEEEQIVVDYFAIAEKLKLSESSIRDYVQRIINKGIPIQKIKENNKKIIIFLPEDFKKLASLDTILQLREL